MIKLGRLGWAGLGLEVLWGLPLDLSGAEQVMQKVIFFAES